MLCILIFRFEGNCKYHIQKTILNKTRIIKLYIVLYLINNDYNNLIFISVLNDFKNVLKTINYHYKKENTLLLNILKN